MKTLHPNQLRRLRANLWKLYLLSAMRAALLIIAIVVPFYTSCGLSLRDIFWLQGLFGLTVLLLEVPSGFASDWLGRRHTLLAAHIVAALGMAAYTHADSFYEFLFAEVLLGIGFSFLSGSDTALTWETLEAIGETERFGVVLGRMRFYSNLSEAAASIAGAALAVLSMRLPLIAEAIIYSLSLPLVLTLVEPGVELDAPRQRPRVGPWALLQEAVGLSPGLRWLIVFSAFLSVSTLAAVWYAQPWFGQAGFSITIFGFLWAGLRLATGVFSLLATRILGRLGAAWTFWILIAALGLGYMGPALFELRLAVGFFLLFSFVRGVAVILISDAINRLIPSDRRATLLSCESMIARLIFAPLSPLLGWMADVWSLGTALGCCGLVFTLGSAALLWAWQRAG